MKPWNLGLNKFSDLSHSSSLFMMNRNKNIEMKNLKLLKT